MKITMLSFDSSSTSTGYAVWKNGELEKAQCIHCTKGEDAMIQSIYDCINEYKPQIIVAETPVLVKNPAVQQCLYEIVGAIRGYCLNNNIFFYQMKPNEWRKEVTNPTEKRPRKRVALKKWAIDKVNSIFNYDITDDNIAESILLGLAYINLFSEAT